jgi:hypothetical protein
MVNIINLKENPKAENQTENQPELVQKIKDKKPTKKKQVQKMKSDIQWTAPEFEYYPKSKNWFIATGLIAGLLLLWTIFTKNIFFALLIILSYFLVTIFALKKPNQVRLSIKPNGIKVNQITYRFDNLKSFWIFYEPPKVKELSLRSKKTIMPYIKIPLGEQNPVQVRQVLIKYLPEKKHKESLIDEFVRQIRF